MHAFLLSNFAPMKTLLNLIRHRQSATQLLFYCGVIHLLLALFFLILLPFENRVVLGINLWIKPLKFALSIAIYSLTWVVLLGYIEGEKIKKYFVKFTVFAMSFEMLCVATQAVRGELSHFNQTGTYNIILYALMGIVIVLQTIFSLVLSIRFFKPLSSALPETMVWAIRLGLIISIFFAFQGGFIGQRMAHTVGAPDGGQGIWFFNWSIKHGDLRIAHFFGLHALQLLPAFVWIFRIKNKVPVIVFGLFYFGFVSLLFYYALLGNGFA